MKKLFLLLFMAAFIAAGNVHAADDIAFVNLQEVFKGFYKTQMAQDQIRQQADDIKMERDAMEAEVEALKKDVEELRSDARDETLSDEVRANKRDVLEEKLVDLQKKEQEKADFEKLRVEQIEQQNQRMTKKLFDEIHDAVVTYSKARDFAAVIDSSSQSRIGTEIVLYTSNQFDITADVLEKLNEGRTMAPATEESEVNAEEED